VTTPRLRRRRRRRSRDQRRAAARPRPRLWPLRPRARSPAGHGGRPSLHTDSPMVVLGQARLPRRPRLRSLVDHRQRHVCVTADVRQRRERRPAQAALGASRREAPRAGSRDRDALLPRRPAAAPRPRVPVRPRQRGGAALPRAHAHVPAQATRPLSRLTSRAHRRRGRWSRPSAPRSGELCALYLRAASSVSAMRALTSFVTRRAGSGLSGGKRIVPLAVSNCASSSRCASMTAGL
jgi:hypothetical protein